MVDELQNDAVAETDAVAEATIQPTAKKRGRKPGSHGKNWHRARTAERVRLHRERKREAEEAEAEEKAEAAESQEHFFKMMRQEGLLFFGETEPLVNCISIDEEIEMARIWARLLNVPDIEPGQNKRAYILTVMQAWCSAGCPLLHLESQTLSPRQADPPDIDKYEWPEGSEENFEYESSILGETNA